MVELVVSVARFLRLLLPEGSGVWFEGWVEVAGLTALGCGAVVVVLGGPRGVWVDESFEFLFGLQDYFFGDELFEFFELEVVGFVDVNKLGDEFCLLEERGGNSLDDWRQEFLTLSDSELLSCS